MHLPSPEALADLQRRVAQALMRADELGLTEAALHLNQALVSLDGRGLGPNERAEPNRPNEG